MSKIDLDKLICSLFIQANGKPGFKFRMSNVLEALAEQGLEFDGKDIVEKYRLRGIITGKPSPAVKEVVDSLTPEIMEEAKKELEQKGNKKYLGTSDEYVGHKLRKFDVGDWIIKENYSAQQVIELREESYILDGSISGIETLPKKYVENNYHLWTIQDAKAGDVLIDKYNNVVMYQEPCSNLLYHSFCFVSTKVFVDSGGSHFIEGTYPATKDQRKTLLKAMRTKQVMSAELKPKKIEDKPAEWSEVKENVIDKAVCWLDTLCDYLKDSSSECISDVKDIINRLESLRPQNRWKPSEEQMVALDGICSYIRNKADWEISQDMVSDLYKLSEQLKKLKKL